MARLCLAALAIAAGLASPSMPAKADPSPDLILNGDGEFGQCTQDRAAGTTVPGWTIVRGSPALLCLTEQMRKSAHATGKAAIWGGPYGDSVLSQTIELTQDGNGAAYAVSGVFGTVGKTGRATLTVQFLDAAGNDLAGPVQLTADKAEHRGNLPVGARRGRVTLSFSGARRPGDGGVADNLSLTVAAPVAPAILSPPKSSVPPFDHVFIVMMENTNYSQLVGNARDAPFIDSLIRQGTLLRNYQAVYHPSDQNYLAIAGGDSFVKGSRYFPHIRLGAANLADRIEAVGKSWKSYEQGMGTPCNITTKFDKYYEPDEAPFINFADIYDDKVRCRDHLVDTNKLNADLESAATTPAFAWIAADDYFDGEASGNDGYARGDGSPRSLRVQDRWLKETLTPILNSPAWKTQRSLLILTWDESETTVGNHIATVLVGSQGLVRAGAASDVRYDHYSTSRTIEEALGLRPLTSNDAYAQPINDAFTR